MYGDISNDEADHWNPMSSNPIIPDPINDQNCEGWGEEEHEDIFHDWDYQEEGGDEAHEVSPIIENAKKRPWVVLEIPEKQKSSTTLVIQEQIIKLAESAFSFTSKKQGEISNKEVMDLALECGARYGSNEHDIATQLFVKKRSKKNVLDSPLTKLGLIGLEESTMISTAIECLIVEVCIPFDAF
jgi:hypothetical protein